MNNMKKEIFEKIKMLQTSNEDLIYNSNMVTLNYYYEYILTKYNTELASIFLNSFTVNDVLNYSTIEKKFIDFIYSNMLFYIDSNFDSFENKKGIYLILNQDDEIIYIGKSSNLSSRSIQSFISKLPYGANKLIPFEISFNSIIEAVGIDYYTPICNQKFESLGEINRKFYAKLVLILSQIQKKEQQYKFEFKQK